MEISSELKTLYRHWRFHTAGNTTANFSGSIDRELLQEISGFINLRMQVWERKTRGEQPPFTTNQILRDFRFCNIYRELDRQTIQIHQDLVPLRSDFNLWLLNLAFHRFICNPQTVAKVGHLSFDPDNNQRVMQKLKELRSPKYGTAYIFPISVIQRSKYPTREQFFCQYLPTVIPWLAPTILALHDTTVLAALDQILPTFGFNFRFHWTEILIDIHYQFPELINLDKDFFIGPGAMPTLKRLSTKLSPQEVLNLLPQAPLSDFPYLTFDHKPIYLTAENWEGIACEFRKYTNLKNGKGRKRKFHQVSW